MAQRFATAKVVEVDIDQPLRAVEVDPRYRDVLLVVRSGAEVVGETLVPGLRQLTPETQGRAIFEKLGTSIWRTRLGRAFERAVAGEQEERHEDQPSVTVVVCTRNRPEELARCLDSIEALATKPSEVIVVDNAPSDDRTAALCATHDVRYVVEAVPGAARARNRGVLESRSELIAFTDDDCVVDRFWLDDLADGFGDPRVLAVVGVIEPLALETESQYLFEAHGGFERHYERVSFDGFRIPPSAAGVVGASANMIVRRSAFDVIGPFAEDLGPGSHARSGEDTYAFYLILAAGYRILADPARLVWHDHRSDRKALKRILKDYAIASSAFTTRCAFRHRDVGAARNWLWWWFNHVPRDIVRILRRDERRVPFRIVLAELAGTLAGPWMLLRSSWSRRRVAPLELPPAPPRAKETRIRVGDEASRLSVVLPSRNRAERLTEALRALGRQTFPADRFEAVVVLDGAEDGSAETVRRLELPYPVTVVERLRQGIGASRNDGYRAARHPVVVFLDDDVVAEEQVLAVHAEAHRLAAHEHVALAPYYPAGDDSGLFGLVLRSWWSDHFRRKSERDHPWTFADVVTGNLSLPRSLLEAMGGFDADFRSRHEDWELGARLLERGVPIRYYREAVAHHYLDLAYTTALEKARAEATADVLLARKHPHLRERLPLAAVAGKLADAGASKALFAYRHPDASHASVAIGAPFVGMLEAFGFRGRWWWAAQTLLHHAYILGLHDSLSTPEELLTFTAGMWEGPVRPLAVALDRSGPLPTPEIELPVELAIELRGKGLTSLAPLEPAAQWEWARITERFVEDCGRDVLEALVSDRTLVFDPARLLNGQETVAREEALVLAG